ncbi:MAG: hypothetical protein C0179_03980 [Fervidicoccus sp.]|nr:MAG: hypothetical protein C0179_03980 [Fervidicoccus sp.]
MYRFITIILMVLIAIVSAYVLDYVHVIVSVIQSIVFNMINSLSKLLNAPSVSPVFSVDQRTLFLGVLGVFFAGLLLYTIFSYATSIQREEED